MMRSYWYLVPLAAVLGMAAMGRPYGTPILVLGLALGIFFGTVSLRGHRAAQDATSTHPGL
jgi:Na+/H+ antiporter NhaC